MFITWICPLLQPTLFLADTIIFNEEDPVNMMYFLLNGECGCVLPQRYNHFKYVNFDEGNFFGVVDILGSCLEFEDRDEDLEYWLENWYNAKSDIRR